MPTAAAIGITGLVGAAVGSNSASKARKAQASAADSATQATQQGAAQARADVNNIFPQAQIRGQQGFQSALDVFRSSAPQQANQFQQGNMAAQQAILAGLPQMQNAILGGPVDLSQLQAFEAAPVDFGFIPQNINPVQFELDQQAAAQQGVNQNPLLGTGNTSPLSGLPSLDNFLGSNRVFDGNFFNRSIP